MMWHIRRASLNNEESRSHTASPTSSAARTPRCSPRPGCYRTPGAAAEMPPTEEPAAARRRSRGARRARSGSGPLSLVRGRQWRCETRSFSRWRRRARRPFFASSLQSRFGSPPPRVSTARASARRRRHRRSAPSCFRSPNGTSD